MAAKHWIVTGLAGTSVLSAILTAGKAIPAGPGWIATIVAAVGGVLSTIIGPTLEWTKRVGDSELDRRAERDRLQRAGGVQVRGIERFDAVKDLGVHQPITFAGMTELPQYVQRTVDLKLDQAVRLGGLVILQGSSAVGKTRTAVEAVRRNAVNCGWKRLVLPQDGAALRTLAESGFDFSRSIIWLDDLERFIGIGALDEGLIRALSPPDRPDILILATLRANSRASMLARSDDPTGVNFPRSMTKLLLASTVFQLDRNLTSSEQREARTFRSDPRIGAALDAVGDVGFAEYLAAGPAALDHWLTGRAGGGEIGASLISASIDFRRAGYLAPVPGDWLKEASTAYLPADLRGYDAASIEEGFAWATARLNGAAGCLKSVGDGKYVVFDFLVDYAQTQAMDESDPDDPFPPIFHQLREIPEEVWHTIGDHIDQDDPYYLSCASLSSFSLHPGLMFRVQREELENGRTSMNFEQKLALARTCVENRVCVACEFTDMKIDLGAFMHEILDLLDPYLTSTMPVVGARELDALVAVEGLDDDGAALTHGSDVNKVVLALPAHRIRQLSALLAREGRDEASEVWSTTASYVQRMHEKKHRQREKRRRANPKR